MARALPRAGGTLLTTLLTTCDLDLPATMIVTDPGAGHLEDTTSTAGHGVPGGHAHPECCSLCRAPVQIGQPTYPCLGPSAHPP